MHLAFFSDLPLRCRWWTRRIGNNTAFGPATTVPVSFSLFGATWLLAILAGAGQVAINDGNYYESINGGQNLLGGRPKWRRTYTCLILAAAGGLAAYIVPYHVTNGFVKLGAIQAITLPSACIIMAADHFLVPRFFKVSRPMSVVPRWDEAGLINIPAVATGAASGRWFAGRWHTKPAQQYILVRA